LIPNGDLPTGSASRWLHLPLEQARNEQGHSMRQLALFALVHVLDLLGQVRDIEPVKLALAQKSCLFIRTLLRLQSYKVEATTSLTQGEESNAI
jgi:hypothetical protein